MTYAAIQAVFPHYCAHPLRLCRICRWVLDHRGAAITNDEPHAPLFVETPRDRRLYRDRRGVTGPLRANGKAHV